MYGKIVLQLTHDFPRDFQKKLQHFVPMGSCREEFKCLFLIHKCTSRVTWNDCKKAVVLTNIKQVNSISHVCLDVVLIICISAKI